MANKTSRIAILAGLAAVFSLPAAAATSEWKIDPPHSSAQFAVRHLTISTVRGAFTKVTGTVQLDDQDITKSSVEVTIDAASVDTRVPDRDQDLRSDRFFEVAKYPTITFKSKKVELLARPLLANPRPSSAAIAMPLPRSPALSPRGSVTEPTDA